MLFYLLPGFLTLSVTTVSRQRGLFIQFSVKSFCRAYQQSKQSTVYLALHVVLCSWMGEQDTDSDRVRGSILIRALFKIQQHERLTDFILQFLGKVTTTHFTLQPPFPLLLIKLFGVQLGSNVASNLAWFLHLIVLLKSWNFTSESCCRAWKYC